MVIDFHSHILPGIDDGSRSVEESIAMLRMEAAQGIRTVVATPHFDARYERPEQFLEKRARAEERLRKALAGDPELPEILIGAEVYYFSGISDSEALPQLTIREKRCILIEMPQAPWTPAMYRELEQIRVRWGIIPIIAHVDRYISPLRTHHIPQRLEELPVLVQANASFFTDRATAGMAIRMLRDDQIHLLGSDCHNLDQRKPNLAAAVERIRRKLGDEALARINGYGRDLLED